MPVSVVIGGQYGSEGKGKTAYYFSKKLNAKAVVRVGGSNSGHTVIDESGKEWVFRHLPTAALIKGVKCIIPSGAFIDADVLVNEIEITGLSTEELIIDPNAVLITSEDKKDEHYSSLKEEIGSTQSGTGSAVLKRIKRNKDVEFVGQDSRLEKFVNDTKSYMRLLLNDNKRIIIEGTQGHGLSLLHSNHYPFTTSRDTSAAAFVSETGLSPLDVDQVIMVLRSFPIRVGGNSGPLEFETDWEFIKSSSGKKTSIKEYTTVTNRLRRVAHFNPELVLKAIELNTPTTVVLNHLDYIDSACGEFQTVTRKAEQFLKEVERNINKKIDFVGTSPQNIVERKLNEKLINKTSPINFSYQ